MQTHADVMNLWPSATALANDLGEKPANIRHWRRVGYIPSSRYDDVIAAAAKRRFKGVTYVFLASSRPR